MARTVDEIVRASTLPLSIVIVGVGSADFSLMEQLDGDEVALQSGGVKASRDIVQFVEFRKFGGDGVRLAREVLEEIPLQLVSFMMSRGFRPNPPPELQNLDVAIAAQPPAQPSPGPAPAPAPAAAHAQQSPPYPTGPGGSPQRDGLATRPMPPAATGAAGGAGYPSIMATQPMPPRPGQ
mmetsp:Transcript_29152/g.68686  ORF Transcript_29152/g.68686 Transcript_29152/m.68686 type:complete len:180 (-) Transcript_29152:40-579(-)